MPSMLFSSNSNNQLIKGLIESYFCNQNRSGFTFSLCLVKLVPNTETETFPVNKCSLSDLNSNISLHLYMWRWGISSRKKVECFVVTSVKISPLSRFQTPYHHLETQISLYHHHNPVDAGPWNISSWGSTQGSHHNCLIQFYTQSPCTSLQVTWVLPSSLSVDYPLQVVGLFVLVVLDASEAFCWMLK